MEARRGHVLPLEDGHLGNSGVKLSITWRNKHFIFCVSEVNDDLS